MIYLDTGCLVKLYYPEPDSHLVAARVRGRRIVFTALHELELTNALRLKRFHKQGSKAQVQAALQLVAGDVQSGVLETASVDWNVVLQRGVLLSNAHSEIVGCRSLDIAHCAAALVLGVVDFLSTDIRQCRLAKDVGLNVLVP